MIRHVPALLLLAGLTGCESCPTDEVTLTFVEQLEGSRPCPIDPFRVPVRNGILQLERRMTFETDAGGCTRRQLGEFSAFRDGGMDLSVRLGGVIHWTGETTEAELDACVLTSLEPPRECCGTYLVRLTQ
jgi:hypothetical protein